MLQEMGIMSFAQNKWVKAVVYAFVLVGLVLGLSVAPGVSDTALAAGKWCSSKPSRVFQKGWQKFPTDPNLVMILGGRNLTAQIREGKVYTYFNNEWIGLSWHGYMNDEYGSYNQWGVSTKMPGKYPRSWNNVNNWRIDFWSPDGKCK